MAALARRHRLGSDAAARLDALLDALAAEADPPTTVVDPRRAVDVHLADSLSGLEIEGLREADKIADVGAGAGFPGLPLAIGLPRTHLDLIESARRKCEVIARLSAAAGTQNVRVVTARAEEWARGEGAGRYRAVTARALASLAVLCEYAAPLLAPGGALVCWKGARDAVEERVGAAAAAVLGLEVAEIRRVQPFHEARDRHLHVFVKVATTPARFPRRTGMAAKRPIQP